MDVNSLVIVKVVVYLFWSRIYISLRIRTESKKQLIKRLFYFFEYFQNPKGKLIDIPHFD
jgi:hypothetical protein